MMHIPDQVLSTFVLWGCGFVVYRGCLSVFHELPSATTVLVVICIGVVLGLLTAGANPNENDTKVPKLDR